METMVKDRHGGWGVIRGYCMYMLTLKSFLIPLRHILYHYELCF